MVLVLSALAYLALSMVLVLAIDFAICHRYRPRQAVKSAVPAFSRTAAKRASLRIRS